MIIQLWRLKIYHCIKYLNLIMIQVFHLYTPRYVLSSLEYSTKLASIIGTSISYSTQKYIFVFNKLSSPLFFNYCYRSLAKVTSSMAFSRSLSFSIKLVTNHLWSPKIDFIKCKTKMNSKCSPLFLKRIVAWPLFAT